MYTITEMSLRAAARKVPALVNYLESTQKEGITGTLRVAGPRLAAALGATALAGIVGNLVAGGFVGWVAGNLVLIGGTAWAWFSSAKVAANRDPRLHEGRAAAARLAKIGNSGQLLKEVDARALLALEACAHHWHRITVALSGPQWDRDVPGHWEMVRSQGLRAADLGMAEAVLLAETCVGKPVKSREQKVSEAFQDLFSLEIGSALDGLRELSRSNWTKYTHKSPNAPSVVPRLLEVASDLGRLASEVESANANLSITGGGNERESAQAIDMAISELKMIQTAESEIDRLDQY